MAHDSFVEQEASSKAGEDKWTWNCRRLEPSQQRHPSQTWCQRQSQGQGPQGGARVVARVVGEGEPT